MRTNPSCEATRISGRDSKGFTILELVAVVAIISVLVSLLCAALNNTKGKAQRVQCLSNLHELQYAWMLYVIENDDYVPLNQTAPAPAYKRVFSRNSSTNSWVVGNPTVDVTDRNIRIGSLFPHVRSTQVYRCPMDESTVVNHPEIPRTRSYSINAFLGGDNPEDNPRVKMRLADWVNPGKESTFVFIEEHKESIWTPGFMVFPKDNPISISSQTWASTPSDRHNQGCNLSFADGHVEYWRWYSPKDRKSTTKMAGSSRELTDIRRLQVSVPQDK